MDRNDKISLYALGMTLSAVLVCASLPSVLPAPEGGRASVGLFDWIEPAAAVVTAFGTLVLGAFTIVLARETRRLADVGDQPNIVVTFEINRYSMLHLDMYVENTGTATAYDIRISVSPELNFGRDRGPREVPLRRISLLKPKQSLSSSFADWSELEPRAFTITTSWLRKPGATYRERLSYDIDLEHMRGMSRLGGDPTVDAARAAKKIADELERLSRGYNKLSVNIFDAGDREEERRDIERRINRRQRTGPAPASDPAAAAPPASAPVPPPQEPEDPGP